jgi:hypothetical protein
VVLHWTQLRIAADTNGSSARPQRYARSASGYA